MVNTDSEPTDRAFCLAENYFGITSMNYSGVVVLLFQIVPTSKEVSIRPGQGVVREI